MMNITTGTEKQNAWANDIISKPVKSVQENVERIEKYVAMGYENDGTVINPLRAAIEIYENRLNEFAATLTASYVIENRSIFSRLMQQCISIAFKNAGMECSNPSKYTA